MLDADLICPGPAWQPLLTGGPRALPGGCRGKMARHQAVSPEASAAHTGVRRPPAQLAFIKPHPRCSAPTNPAAPRILSAIRCRQLAALASQDGAGRQLWPVLGTLASKTRGRGPGLEKQLGGCVPTPPFFSALDPSRPAEGVGRAEGSPQARDPSWDNCPCPLLLLDPFQLQWALQDPAAGGGALDK